MNKKSVLNNFYLKIAEEWHPTRNENLTPKDVASGSHKKVWWKCKFGHEWEAKVYSRKNHGCPYCFGRFADNKNSLQKFNPKLAKEWHPIKNIELTPEQIKPNSEKIVWWQCKCGYEWEDKIRLRNNGKRCPKCVEALKHQNSLAVVNSKLAMEWDYEKNKLTPYEVTPGVRNKVWWKCSKGHSWEANVYARKGSGCPVCSGRTASIENNFKVLNPELAKEWHPTKNGEEKPENFKISSNKKVWWLCSKNKNHEWDAIICDRNNGNGCPYCAGKKVDHDNCLAAVEPELAKEWHPTKNGNLTPKDVTPGQRKKVWWKCSKNHEYEAYIYNRNTGNGCPYCVGKKVNHENCLSTVNPELSKEWCYEKNVPLTPYDVTSGSAKKVWWQCKLGHEWKASIVNRNKGRDCSKCSNQSSTIELALFEIIKCFFPHAQHRIKIKCYMKAREVDILIPEYRVAIEYDGYYYHKNDKDKEEDINKNIDLKNENITLIRIREYRLDKISDIDLILTKYETSHYLKPEIIKKIVLHIFNQLPKHLLQDEKIIWYINSTIPLSVDLDKLKKSYRTTTNNLDMLNPMLAKEWHPTKNKDLTPKDLTSGSRKKVWWQCKLDHEWQTRVSHRVYSGTQCPECSRSKVTLENSLAKLYPQLSLEWHPTKNGKLTPEHVRPGSGKKRWWLCLKNKTHEWESTINNRKNGNGCPHCHRTTSNNMKCCSTNSALKSKIETKLI